jgi:hypothetical protein
MGLFPRFYKNIYYRNGNIYIIGTTTGSANLGTLGTEYPNSWYTLFIANFKIALLTFSIKFPICIGNTLEIKASGTNYLWKGPNGFTSTLQNPTLPMQRL